MTEQKSNFISYLKFIYSFVVKLRFSLRVSLLNFKDEISVHKSCLIHKRTFIKIWKGGSIKIKRECEIMPGAMLLTYGGKIEIGENCSIGPYCIIYGHGGVTIGNNVLIAGATMIIPNKHLFKDASVPIALQGNESLGIVIEEDVWIGHACSILDGIKIGKGSVIAAGSVVNDDVEPYSVMGGVPARLLTKRNI